MSDTVSIDAPLGESAESLAAPLAGIFQVAPTGFGGVSIGVPGEKRIVLNPNPYAELEDPESMATISRLLGGASTSFTLTTSNMDLVRRVLLKLAERRDLVLDTQHGMILWLHEFADLIRARPTWDWRS